MERSEMLKKMDRWLRKNIQDEELFMVWLYVMPDGATDADYEDMAGNDEIFNDCTRVFAKLVILNS